jgi:hypothetical protein
MSYYASEARYELTSTSESNDAGVSSLEVSLQILQPFSGYAYRGRR